MAGLTWFASDDFTRADAEFKRAIDDTGWPDGDGKEVVHLFRGSSAGIQGRLEDARASYLRALDLNPEYGRAMIGLAEVRLHEASRSCEPDSVDAEGLREARDQYRAAAAALDQPPLSSVPAKSHFGVARVDICLSQATVEGAWLEAADELRAVISDFESGNETLQDLAAEAHGQLAEVSLPAKGSADPGVNYLAAADEYRAAIRLSKHRNRQAIFSDNLGWVLERLGDLDAAARAYDQAIEFTTSDEARQVYRQHRQRLDATASPVALGVERRTPKRDAELGRTADLRTALSEQSVNGSRE